VEVGVRFSSTSITILTVYFTILGDEKEVCVNRWVNRQYKYFLFGAKCDLIIAS
jgi:hypothetical protein